jgi:hypothetical protein
MGFISHYKNDYNYKYLSLFFIKKSIHFPLKAKQNKLAEL